MRRFFVAALSGALLAVLSTQAGAGTRAFGFKVVETPMVEKPGLLAAVAALSPADVWAVGEAGGEALVEHWDGSAWATLPAPSPGDSASLLGISALAPDDVWTAGVASLHCMFSVRALPAAHPIGPVQRQAAAGS